MRQNFTRFARNSRAGSPGPFNPPVTANSWFGVRVCPARGQKNLGACLKIKEGAAARDCAYGIRLADKSFVARKFQTSGTVVRTALNNAALNLRMGTVQMAGVRAPARPRVVPSPRRRLAVAIQFEPPQPVIIRHIAQNLGNSVTETRQIQNQRA
jgi:hypothetical protein